MKKNNMLRIASVLLVAVLLSTCAISGAFAKYTTSGEATDSARVAAFGIQIAANASEAFANSYNDKADDGKIIPAVPAVADGKGFSVVGKSDAVVVAPGTEGKFAAFDITGEAEVAVELTTTVALELGNETNWLVGETGDDFYCPIKITKDDDVVVDGLTCTSVADFEAKVAALTTSDIIAPNSTVATSTVWGWSWAFDGNDGYDTDLGRNSANNTIELTVTVTVAQID